jgi:hypothetical protein
MIAWGVYNDGSELVAIYETEESAKEHRALMMVFDPDAEPDIDELGRVYSDVEEFISAKRSL